MNISNFQRMAKKYLLCRFVGELITVEVEDQKSEVGTFIDLNTIKSFTMTTNMFLTFVH